MFCVRTVPVYNPVQEGSCFAYWTSDIVSTSGANVTSMPNLSGVGTTARNLLAVGTGPKLLAADGNFRGAPSVVGVSSVASRLESTLDITLVQPSTVYAVIRVETNANYMTWRHNAGNFANSAGMFIDPSNDVGILTQDSANAITSAPIASAGTNYVSCAIYDNSGGTSAIYMNNSQTAVAKSPGDGSVDTNNCSVMSIGTTSGEECNYSWTCQIAFNGIHTAATRQRVMQWLGLKYGIAPIV